MSTIMTPIPVVLQPPTLPVHRFSVDQYHKMIETGTLSEDDRVELLEGLIVPKMPRNPPHDGSIQLADEAIRPNLPSGWQLRIQSAITTDDSEPEPDLTIVEGPARRFISRHPGPSDVKTLIEVADTTVQRDRVEKGRIYARASISIYWIINLVDRQVEVYTDSTGPDANPRYRQRQDYGARDSVPLVIEGNEVARIVVSALLP